MQLFLDSFDHYADADKASKWTQYVTSGTSAGSADTTIAAVGARSTNGLRMRTSTGIFTGCGSLNCVPSTPAPSGATLIVGFRYRCVTAFNLQTVGTDPEAFTAANSCLFACRLVGVTQWWVRVNTDGTLSVYRGTTLLGTTSSALTQNVYAYVEIKVLLHASAGTVDVRFNGFSVLALTGVNTQNAGSSVWNEFRFGPFTNASVTNAKEWNIDDLYVADASGSAWNDFKGDTRVDATFPNAAGNTSNFTRSTGSDQSATIDEAAANGDTDYNSSAVISDKDTLNFPNAPVPGADIFGLQVVVQVRKTDAGAAGHKAVTRIAGTDYLGTEYGVPSAYAFIRQSWPVKPSDSTSWTESDFNSAEFGYAKSS